MSKLNISNVFRQKYNCRTSTFTEKQNTLVVFPHWYKEITAWGTTRVSWGFNSIQVNISLLPFLTQEKRWKSLAETLYKLNSITMKFPSAEPLYKLNSITIKFSSDKSVLLLRYYIPSHAWKMLFNAHTKEHSIPAYTQPHLGLNPFTAEVAIMPLLGSAPKSHLYDQRRRSIVTGLSDLMTLFIDLRCLYCKQTQRAFNVFKNKLNWLKNWFSRSKVQLTRVWELLTRRRNAWHWESHCVFTAGGERVKETIVFKYDIF
jgi:hypothetical protein